MFDSIMLIIVTTIMVFIVLTLLCIGTLAVIWAMQDAMRQRRQRELTKRIQS